MSRNHPRIGQISRNFFSNCEVYGATENLFPSHGRNSLIAGFVRALSIVRTHTGHRLLESQVSESRWCVYRDIQISTWDNEAPILILILITSFRHSWVKGNANCDMKHSMRALLQGEALASRDVMPSSFYSTVPKSCSHWSSLLLGTTLEHTKTLWTLCPTKLMAFCKIGPSKRSSNKHRIFCCSYDVPSSSTESIMMFLQASLNCSLGDVKNAFLSGVQSFNLQCIKGNRVRGSRDTTEISQGDIGTKERLWGRSLSLFQNLWLFFVFFLVCVCVLFFCFVMMFDSFLTCVLMKSSCCFNHRVGTVTVLQKTNSEKLKNILFSLRRISSSKWHFQVLCSFSRGIS